MSVCYWANYVSKRIKLYRKSKHAVECNRVLKFVYDK